MGVIQLSEMQTLECLKGVSWDQSRFLYLYTIYQRYWNIQRADIYADDTTVSANVDHRSAPGALDQVLQADVGKVAQWTTDNKMVLNEFKTKTILVAGKRLHKKMSSSLSM